MWRIAAGTADAKSGGKPRLQVLGIWERLQQALSAPIDRTAVSGPRQLSGHTLS
jgi:hypothetical protein